MFRPKIFETLKHYNRQQFGKDVMAGLIVGIVALPLAIAFAIASGVSPEKGLYTAVIAGFIIFCASGFGGTKALGWLTSATLLIATLTNLVLLPVLLLLFAPKKTVIKKG